MARVISEMHRYTRDHLAEIAKGAAKMEIVGGMYVGKFGGQTVEWMEDGSVVIVTAHSPAEAGELVKRRGR